MEELVLSCVMPYIQDNHVLNSVSLVSKNFFDIDCRTRKHVTVHEHYLPDPKRLSIRFPNLESLKLKSYYSYVRDSTEECNIPVTPWIQEIALKFTRLNSLCIRNMIVSPSDLKLLARTRGDNLRSLEITGCNMLSEDGLVDIARYCVKLTSLRLKCNDIDCAEDGKWLHELALCNTVMESLDFGYQFISYDEKDFTRLANKCSNSLVYLNIHPPHLNSLREVFKHAKKLNHFGYGKIDEDSDYSGFKFPPNIRSLHIGELQKDSLPFLQPYLNQLQELELTCGRIEDNCQCVLFENCPNLEVLHTQDICGDEGLQVIGQFCKKLRKLTHYGGVTQTGIINLAQGCPNLEYLLDSFSNISNEALECVGAHLKNLRDFHIYLGMKDGITDLPLDNGVRNMLMGCRKLERLDINLCPGGLTDVGLGFIGEYGHDLRHLSLSNTGESDAGLIELSKGCPKLRKLNLRDCPFSDQAIATFVFNINHSLRYIRVERDACYNLVLTRPMVSAAVILLKA